MFRSRPIFFVLYLFSCLTISRAADGPAGKGFLVIAPERFHAALAPYIEHKQRQLPTFLISLETALAGSEGSDDPEKLKRFLYSRCRERNASYVLLVGDAEVLPVRYMVLDRVTPAAFDYAFYPSDLYYSDLAKADGSFDDWNAQKEGFHGNYFGEVRGEKNKHDPVNFDAVDYRPDIALGRWPVSNPGQAALVAAKTIRYETGLIENSKAGARRAAFFAVAGWVDSRGAMDSAAISLGKTWEIEKRYYADQKRDDKTDLPDFSHLNALLNQGAGLVIHAGHGSDSQWERCFSTADIANLANTDRLPILMSVGCSTARFATLPPYEAYIDSTGNRHKGTDAGETFSEPPPPPAPYQSGAYNPSGLGKELLRGGENGAVAYIGCNTGSQPCGMTLMEGFARAVGGKSAAGEPVRLGDCWSLAISHYYEEEHLATIVPDTGWYPASIFFQGMKFMLFGDPTLLVPR
ncbi:MAG: Peptidase family [Chthoniobacteraceae bacterium]|nr:Peptidase family [Chthoniobacteraceae bacterium]